MFSVQTVRDDTVTTLAVSGELDVGAHSRFGEEIDRAVAERPATLVIDLLAVTVLDSRGFAELVGVRNELAESPTTRLVIGRRSPRVSQMFRLMRLDTAFVFDPPLEQAG